MQAKVKKQKNVQAKNAQPKKRQNKQNAKMLKSWLPVSHCGVHYAAVLADPFYANHGACIPAELFPLPSQKVTVLTRGTFALGTTGIGYVMFNPSVTSDTIAGVFTNATSVGTNSTAFTAFTNTSQFTCPSLPYANAKLTDKTIQARIVGCGLRAQYAGSLMNRNGSAFMYEEPDHQAVNGMTYDQIASFPQSEQVNVTNYAPQGEHDWMTSFSFSGPVTPSDVEFLSSPNPFGGAFMIIAVSGIPGDKWSFEVIQHVEYIGSGSPERTPSHSDPVVFSKALESAKSITAVAPLTPDRMPSFLEGLSAGIQETLPIIQDGANLIKSAIKMDIGGVLQAGASLLTSPATKKIILPSPGSHKPKDRKSVV